MDKEVTPSSNSTPLLDVNEAVALYVELRDKKAEMTAALKEALKPYNKGLEDLEAVLLKHLQDTKAQKIGTPAGTVYQRVERSATIKDKKAFREYVIENSEYDLIDWRANKVQVFEHIEKKHLDVPGVNTSAFMTVGVLRGSSTQEE